MKVESPSIDVGLKLVHGEQFVGVKLQATIYELNLVFSDQDASRLHSCSLPESPELSIRAGACFGTPVFWSQVDNKYLALVIGHDDVTWDAGFWLPLDAFDDMLNQLAQWRARL